MSFEDQIIMVRAILESGSEYSPELIRDILNGEYN